jgi:Protein of unknown function (DUF3800)
LRRDRVGGMQLPNLEHFIASAVSTTKVVSLPSSAPQSWIFYVDDSGNGQIELLTAVGIPFEQWFAVREDWLKYRRLLLATASVPVHYELHASKFLGGRGLPSPDSRSPVNFDQAFRNQIYKGALDRIHSLPIEIITVAAIGNFGRIPLYRALLRKIASFLESNEGTGIIVLDGDDRSVRKVHRETGSHRNRVLEDPWMQDSSTNQFLQMADLVVHSAFQSMVRYEKRRECWDWYPALFRKIEKLSPELITPE